MLTAVILWLISHIRREACSLFEILLSFHNTNLVEKVKWKYFNLEREYNILAEDWQNNYICCRKFNNNIPDCSRFIAITRALCFSCHRLNTDSGKTTHKTKLLGNKGLSLERTQRWQWVTQNDQWPMWLIEPLAYDPCDPWKLELFNAIKPCMI